jgi:hypothetical protein
MNHELCKKLKDAGFPQKGYIGAKYYNFIGHPRLDIPYQYAQLIQIESESQFDKIGGYILIPTLSELIEACGNSLIGMSKYKDGIYSIGWYSMYHKEFDSMASFIYGATFEESIANLWLKLNENNSL